MPEEMEIFEGALEGNQEKKVQDLENEAIVSNTAEMIENPFADAKEAELIVPDLRRAVAKEPVEHLNFRSEKFNTAPQEAESVETVKEMEKYLRDTNAMMEDVEDDNIELEKSLRKQEIIVERMTKVSDSNRSTAASLTKKQSARDEQEEAQFEGLTENLDAHLTLLNEKRGELESKVPTDMNAKVKFVNSIEGQGLIEDLLTTLGQNNQDLIALATSMVQERNVVTEDPRSEFEEVVTLLQEKHSWVEQGESLGEQNGTIDGSATLTPGASKSAADRKSVV